MTHPKKKLLYFDIDGTILDGTTKAVKKSLQNGQLEITIREANFDKIFCVGNVNEIFKGLEEMGQHVDNIEIVYTLCFDAFTDFEWFMNNACCTKNPDRRIEQIQYNEDWWYMDVFAEKYVNKSEIRKTIEQHRDKRIFVPNAQGDGQDIINWISTL